MSNNRFRDLTLKTYQTQSKPDTSDVEYVTNQKKVIDIHNKKVRRKKAKPQEDDDRVDLYDQYIFNRGLDNTNNIQKFIPNNVNVFSYYREKNTTIVKANSTVLSNPFSFTSASDIMTIYHPNHGFLENDKITITGVLPRVEILNTRVASKVGNTVEYDDIIVFGLGPDKDYVKIVRPHGLALDSTYDLSDVTITLSGFQGTSDEYFNNIPINQINTTHQILLEDPDRYNIITEDCFFIKLDKALSGTYELASYNIKIIYNYLYGIPINLINAGLPLSHTQITPYHKIVSVTTNTYTIKLLKTAGASTGYGEYDGGKNIIITHVSEIIPGYPEPNDYIYTINHTLRNVVSVRLLSFEFPNTDRVIKTNKNKLYWKNYDDGEYEYSIEITPGSYNPDTLKTELETLFYNTERINYAKDVLTTTVSPYSNHNYIKVDINVDTDIVKFSCYREAILTKPFLRVTPQISVAENNDEIANPVVSYDVKIKHASHGLSVGDKIIISNSLAYFGIPADDINKEQTVSSVSSVDEYSITLNNITLESATTRKDNGGGIAVYIYTPNQFRMLFNYSDTIGKVLGFRNVGLDGSITPYGSVIKNTDAYEDEVLEDESGEIKTIKNNSLLLAGDHYVLMTCNGWSNMQSAGPVKDPFAKILLSGSPNKVLFNTFVDTPIHFEHPIPEISELRLKFYDPYGELFDFNGIDHSFTMEFITLEEMPHKTNINARTGRTAIVNASISK